MAKLYFHYAAMNAGKSASLLQANHNYRSRGMETLLLKSKIDNRESEIEIASRIGIRAKATGFGTECDLLHIVATRQAESGKPISCVFVDEAQFMTADQVRQLARVVDRLLIPVMCYGLRTDFTGNLFPGSAALLALADEIEEEVSICHCGRKANMVVRRNEAGEIVTSGAQILIGDVGGTYESLCRKHWAEATGL